MRDIDLQGAKKEVDALIAKLGEDDFADLVEEIANDRLKTAVGRLMSSQWWQQTLKLAMTNATQYNTQLLCKLLDKAVPTQQAVKIGADEGFKLIIERIDPLEKSV